MNQQYSLVTYVCMHVVYRQDRYLHLLFHRSQNIMLVYRSR